MTAEEIKSLARLAKLEFDDERCASFKDGFDEIIAFADRINQEVEGDVQTIHGAGSAERELEELREDCVQPSLENGKILSNAEGADGFFPVRRVVK